MAQCKRNASLKGFSGISTWRYKRRSTILQVISAIGCSLGFQMPKWPHEDVQWATMLVKALFAESWIKAQQPQLAQTWAVCTWQRGVSCIPLLIVMRTHIYSDWSTYATRDRWAGIWGGWAARLNLSQTLRISNWGLWDLNLRKCVS